MNATTSVVKTKTIKKALLPELKTGNKSAISRILGISRNSFYYKSLKGANPRVTRATLEHVVTFYNSEDITTTYPNKQRNGQVFRVLKYSREQTFKMFAQEYPEDKIGKTTFHALKPKGIKLMKHARWFQCLCDICDNVTMLMRAIRLSMQRSEIQPPSCLNNEIELAKAVVCDLNDFDCLDRKCTNCSAALVKSDFDTWISNDPQNTIQYQKWFTIAFRC